MSKMEWPGPVDDVERAIAEGARSFRRKITNIHVTVTKGRTNMATKRRTDFEPENDEQLYEASTLPLELARPEAKQPTQVFFPALPNYVVDRRSDARARDYSDCIKLPYRDGYLEKFKRIADPGYYFIELRAVNVIVGDEGVIEIAPNLHSATQPAPVERQPSEQPQPAASSARNISDTTETIRATKELLKEVAPPAQQHAPAGLTKEDVAQIVAEVIARHAPQQPAQQAPDTFTLLDKVFDWSKKLQPPQPERTEQSSATDQIDQTLSIVDKLSSYAERINPPTGGDGVLNGIANVLNALGVKEIVKPIGQIATAALLSRGIRMPGAAMPQAAPPQQPVQMPAMPPPMQVIESAPEAAAPVAESATRDEAEDTEEKLTLEIVLGNIAGDILENKPPKDSVNDVALFVAENPELAPTVAQLMEQSNAELIDLLAQVTGKNVAVISNANKFIDGLRAGVRKRLAPPPMPAPVNGNGAAHAQAAAQQT